ncbi:MAG TPA: carboxypeptidase-like regulatory domain-containing protein [Pyrinomonadaceae bacterium]|nr:carboxypeptidase-like regulatory domain-containing protein [Pyrinomonadaceae bacterium]
MKTVFRLYMTAMALAVLTLTTPAARACFPTEFETPLCAIYWRSEIVFVAKVKAIDRVVESEPGEEGVYARVRKARLQVEEVLRGEIADEVWGAITSNGGGDCRPLYERGKRYLIYAEYNPAMGEIYTGHYNELTSDNEADFLKSARAFSKPKAEAQVLGAVLSDSLKPWAGVEVLMQSNGQSYSTTTDEKGHYRFVLKPGGEFKVSMIFPFSALEEGYARVEYLSEEPARTVLGYGGSLQAGQCHYIEPHVADVPKQR